MPNLDSWPRTSHYAEGRRIEPIEVIEDWKLDFHLGNVIKYLARLGRDGASELSTLKKAQTYLDRAIHVRVVGDEDVLKCSPGRVESQDVGRAEPTPNASVWLPWRESSAVPADSGGGGNVTPPLSRWWDNA